MVVFGDQSTSMSLLPGNYISSLVCAWVYVGTCVRVCVCLSVRVCLRGVGHEEKAQPCSGSKMDPGGNRSQETQKAGYYLLRVGGEKHCLSARKS